MSFNLKRPCPACPFRSDIEQYITDERKEEIADSLRAGADFLCHKTIEHDEDGEGVRTRDSEFCAGALITMENEGFGNQLMRIGERLGMYRRDELDYDSPVYASLDEWVGT